MREHLNEFAHKTGAESIGFEAQATVHSHEAILQSLGSQNPLPNQSHTLPRLPAVESLGRLLRSECGHNRPCLATGGHLKVAVAAWTGSIAFLTPPIGQMDDARDRAAFATIVSKL